MKAAIEAWVDTQATDIATTLLAAYESDDALAQTYIGYGVPQGSTTPSFVANPNAQADALDYQGSYLRIDGPRVLIELVVQEAVAFRDESWVHYHSVWRDKAADYGAEFTTAIDAGTGTGTGGMGMPDGGMGPGGGRRHDDALKAMARLAPLLGCLTLLALLFWGAPAARARTRRPLVRPPRSSPVTTSAPSSGSP